MKFAIITHVPHLQYQQKWYAYTPYVNEMNLWIKHVDTVLIVAPIINEEPGAIHADYNHPDIQFNDLPSFNIKNLGSVIITLSKMPTLILDIFKVMKNADHIHLRCPGNIGLLGCLVQIFFPKTPKTAKYAGNWDPKAKQPLSYKLQKWILSNTLLTKNMQVLVYGDWPNQTKNIKAFFTATYSETDKKPIVPRDVQNQIELLFVGTLSAGKQPMYAVQLAEMLLNKGLNIRLRLYGEGNERLQLENYIQSNNLTATVFLQGNCSKKEIQKAYEESHFLILPSKSEGWPKVVAEAMFWGCVPVATPVSCVSNMLDNGNRGVLLDMNTAVDSEKIIDFITQPDDFQSKSVEAMRWSRNYTLERFKAEIQKLLSK